MSYFIILVLLFELSDAHIYLKYPVTRANCFYEYPRNVGGDSIFRGNPCGRPSQGVKAHILSGSLYPLSFRMTVAHMSKFEVAIAPGIAGTGGKVIGTPLSTSYDSIKSVIAEFGCESLPGGCQDDPSGRGDYCVPLKIPNLPAGEYTLQLRQYAPEFKWYYYDCADIQIYSPNSNIVNPTTYCSNATFISVSYPNPIYAQEPLIFGLPGLLVIIMILFDIYWFWKWGKSQNMSKQKVASTENEQIDHESSSTGELEVAQIDTSSTSKGIPFKSVSSIEFGFSKDASNGASIYQILYYSIEKQRKQLAIQFIVLVVLFLGGMGLDLSLRNCSLHTFPEF